MLSLRTLQQNLRKLGIIQFEKRNKKEKPSPPKNNREMMNEHKFHEKI
jgi:hypothetical protein